MPLGWQYCCLSGGTTVAPFEVTLMLLDLNLEQAGGSCPLKCDEQDRRETWAN